MSAFAMTIGGEAVGGESTIEVVNPAVGEVFAEAPDATEAQLDAAMNAAAAAFPAWRQDEGARREALRRCAEALRARADEMGRVLTQEQGKPLKNAVSEIKSSALWFDYFAKLEVEPEVLQDNEKARIEIIRRPLGVVAAITPWNYPVLLAIWKVAPALRAGNCVVLKPSPYTPLSSLLLGEVVRSALPPGVLNVISGGDQLGAQMTIHPAVRKITFTGSIGTGMKVARSAADDLKRVTLELGGNDAAIVLPDADPARVAKGLFWGAFSNTGQVCSAIKRLYIHEDIFVPVRDALADLARAVKVGDGTTEGVELGPINNRPQLDKVRDLVEDARAHGAQTIAGSAPEGAGYFYPPTLVTGAAEGTRVVDEEQFGPVLPLLPFRDVDDAVQRANATRFGLSGSVWSADGDRAAEIAARLECGTAWVNTHVAILPNVPFGGTKWSGIGVEHGPWGLRGFTEIQVLHRSRR